MDIPTSSNDSDSVLELLAVLQGGAAAAIATRHASEDQPAVDHRTLPRSTRRKFDHCGALACIRRDYLPAIGDVSTALMAGDFKQMFRISMSRFQQIEEICD